MGNGLYGESHIHIVMANRIRNPRLVQVRIEAGHPLPPSTFVNVA
jgi:hypothetical protein